MTAVYLFSGLLVLLLVLGLLVGPLLEREPVAGDGEASPEDRRDAELETLREVEFEYETGKLSEEDYHELRARHAEAAVAARREAEARGDGEAAREVETESAAGARCDACGASLPPDARYCTSCGSRVASGEAGGEARDESP